MYVDWYKIFNVRRVYITKVDSINDREWRNLKVVHGDICIHPFNFIHDYFREYFNLDFPKEKVLLYITRMGFNSALKIGFSFGTVRYILTVNESKENIKKMNLGESKDVRRYIENI